MNPKTSTMTQHDILLTLLKRNRFVERSYANRFGVRYPNVTASQLRNKGHDIKCVGGGRYKLTKPEAEIKHE